MSIDPTPITLYPDELLRLAARSEFAAAPPEHVRDWLERNGIAV